MGITPEFMWSILSLLFVTVIGFYFGRWVIFNLGKRKKKAKNKNSSILGDSLAQPMEVYGSGMAPGRSSVTESPTSNSTVNFLSYDPGINPVEK